VEVGEVEGVMSVEVLYQGAAHAGWLNFALVIEVDVGKEKRRKINSAARLH